MGCACSGTTHSGTCRATNSGSQAIGHTQGVRAPQGCQRAQGETLQPLAQEGGEHGLGTQRGPAPGRGRTRSGRLHERGGDDGSSVLTTRASSPQGSAHPSGCIPSGCLRLRPCASPNSGLCRGAEISYGSLGRPALGHGSQVSGLAQSASDAGHGGRPQCHPRVQGRSCTRDTDYYRAPERHHRRARWGGR